MTTEDIKQAERLIREGFSYHDADKVRKLTGTDTDVVEAMEFIFENVILIRMYNLSNAVVKKYAHHPHPPMTISEIRGYMNDISRLMLSDGHGLSHCIDLAELEYAANYLIYEIESNEVESNE